MALKNRPVVTIGVDKYTFFKLLTDETTGATYGEAVPLPGTVEISPTDKGDNSTFDADNGAYATFSYVETMGHEITNADIPPEVDAMWRGLELKNGGVEFDGNVSAPYFGVAWRILKSDGTYRYARYYKGKYGFASNVGGQTKPSEGAPEAHTAQATYSAVKTAADKVYFYIDEVDLPEGLTRDAFEAQFFTDMTYYPTEPPVLGTLSVRNVTNPEGKTAIFVDGNVLPQGNTYRQTITNTAQTVTYGQDLSSWPESIIEMPTYTILPGAIVTVAEVDADNKAVKVGSVTITDTRLGTLTVSASATSPYSAIISVSETPGTGNKFVYKVGDAIQPVSYEEVLNGWEDVITDAVTVEEGKVVTVAEIDAENKAVKLGSATATE